MNKNTELGIIDFSVLSTMEKGGDYACYENVVNALENYIFYNNAMGFTQKNDARNYILSLSKDDIKKELLENIIKKRFCYEQNLDKNIIKNKNFDDDLTISEAEILLYNSIINMSISEIDDIINKYPKLIDLITKSFVDSRYFNKEYLLKNIDKSLSNLECQSILLKIESYYGKKQNAFEK